MMNMTTFCCTHSRKEAHMPRYAWPEVGTFSVVVRTDDEGARSLVVSGEAFPEYVEMADELFISGDARWLRQSDGNVWFTLANGYGHYRLVERDPNFNLSLWQLVEGDVLSAA